MSNVVESSAAPLVFPPLLDVDPGHRTWPRPPFAWRHAAVPAADVCQPCRVETDADGATDGELLGFDPAAGQLTWRGPAGHESTLPLAQVRRLTLTAPLKPMDAGQSSRQNLLASVRPTVHVEGAAAPMLPMAEHACTYTLAPRAPGGAILEGRTVGHVQVEEGHFLFAPVDEDAALLRVFVPRASNGEVAMSRTALALAMQGWATTATELLASIEALRHRPVPQLGAAAKSLGLLTAQQVERCLKENGGERRLGQVLVDTGLVTHAQLQALIAHKMGCAIVDLTRFEREPGVQARLPARVTWAQRALPLCVVDERLYVASDLAFTPDRLRALQAHTPLSIVPVLARTPHLSAILRELDRGDALPGRA